MSEFERQASSELKLLTALVDPKFADEHLNLDTKESWNNNNCQLLGLATQSSDSSNNNNDTQATSSIQK